ncbi:FGGY-family carbohydrate kinase [Zongyangia hominis]|uniref:ATP:glycerol 3-phosphotransferase n=1 Tax=Zongyangia hominis TaxID=2763677 RepID=A0A926EC97_9FIRM|nr:glycerol kinase [Zongyangia hominis]MBC8570430.1 glycerol kinase GlpK [Zongyangia hominis]
MQEKYILSIDQSTAGTKGLLFDAQGTLICRSDVSHRQIIDERGWVEHDAEEIYRNTIAAVKAVVEKAGIDKALIAGVGISNQRETAMAWDRETGKPVYNAIVWQCARGEAICKEIEAKGHASMVKKATGLHLSPYFSAAKLSWILQNVPGVQEKAQAGKLCMGTMDSWEVYKLTGGKSFKTDYSNASRTQMLNIFSLRWDEEICGLFGIDTGCLAELCDSDADYGETDFEGFLPRPIPICGVLGDSHGALFGQGCLQKGMIKTTYGTGSSVMMNIGKTPMLSKSGVVTSIAWSMGGQVDYVLEGNINYTGAVMKWIVEDLGLLSSPKEASQAAGAANGEDETYLVPAFTGLGAPYWDSEARAVIYGMTRTTGKNEIVKAAEECIAYQIADIVGVMSRESGITIDSLRVDGGATRDAYLMQFQSDILNIPVRVASVEELSGVGAAYTAGLSLGLYDQGIFERMTRRDYLPQMSEKTREKKRAGWQKAVSVVLSK